MILDCDWEMKLGLGGFGDGRWRFKLKMRAVKMKETVSREGINGYKRRRVEIMKRARYGDSGYDEKIGGDLGALCIVGEGFGEQGDMVVWTGKIWYEGGERWWKARKGRSHLASSALPGPLV